MSDAIPTPAFPLIDVEGDAESRGRQYGVQARDRIEVSLSIYRPAFETLGIDWDAALARAARFIVALEAFDPEQASELAAIAYGAGCKAEEIMLINARTDILYGESENALPSTFDDGCTGALALPDITAAGHLIHGQNWDWRDACKDAVIILRSHPKAGPATLGLMEAGTLARCGMNAAGVSLTANFLRCDHDPGQGGVPSPFVRQRILARTGLAQAAGEVLRARRSFSNNIMLGDAIGMGVDLETTPREAYWLMPEDGLLVHANHFISPAGLTRVHDTGLQITPDSLYRDRRVRAAMAEKAGNITPHDMLAALRDDFGSPASVNRPPTGGPGGDVVSTVASVVMDVTAGRMFVTPTPYCQSDVHEYRLES